MIQEYIDMWARQFGVVNDPDPLWAVIETMINKVKNYDTACALMFDMSWHNETQKKWLRRCSDELAKTCKENAGGVFDRAYMFEWCAWYVKDIEPEPPKDAT